MNHSNQAHASNPREVIVDKLHGALAILRRERDEAHRAKELSVERLRLARDERVDAENNLHSLQENYDRMVSSNTKDSRQVEIGKLQAEVERLSREVSPSQSYPVSKLSNDA